MEANTMKESRRRCQKLNECSFLSIVSLFLLLWSLLPILFLHRYEEVLFTSSSTADAKNPIQHQPVKSNTPAKKDVIPIEEVIDFLSNWIHKLHNRLKEQVEEIEKETRANPNPNLTVDSQESYLLWWKTYHDLVVSELVPWDLDYLKHGRMPERREDGSIFMSVASYRDENCPTTLSDAYDMAKNPEKLFVGLVQQNCVEDCKSGEVEKFAVSTIYMLLYLASESSPCCER
jgi:hypothetical protein